MIRITNCDAKEEIYSNEIVDIYKGYVTFGRFPKMKKEKCLFIMRDIEFEEDEENENQNKSNQLKNEISEFNNNEMKFSQQKINEKQKMKNKLEQLGNEMKTINHPNVLQLMKGVNNMLERSHHCKDKYWFVFQHCEYKLLKEYIGLSYIYTYIQTQFFVHDIIKSIQRCPHIFPFPSQFILDKDNSPITPIKIIPFQLDDISLRCEELKNGKRNKIDCITYYPPEILYGKETFEIQTNLTKQHCYIFGCILYSLVTGKEYRSHEQLTTEITFEEINIYSNEQNSKINEVLKKCLENEVEKRCSFEELLEMEFIQESISFKENILNFQTRTIERKDCPVKIIGKIGNGNFGIVHKGMMIIDGIETPVAVKEVRSTEMDYQLRKENIIREAIMMKLCSHENLVEFIDFFKTTFEEKIINENNEEKIDTGECYMLVMELCDKGNLLQYMHKRYQENKHIIDENENYENDMKTISTQTIPIEIDLETIQKEELEKEKKSEIPLYQLDENEIESFLKDIANGWNYLHFQQRVLHRDMKSENIFLKEVDGKLIAKIGDYGLSRMKTGEMFYSNAGTPFYQPPEMFITKQYTDKVDLYGIGLVLHEMTFGDYARNNDGRRIHFTTEETQNQRIIYPNDSSIDKDLVDLIKKLTEYDSSLRMTWEQFYQHQFILKLKDLDLRIPSEKEFSLHNSRMLSNSSEDNNWNESGYEISCEDFEGFNDFLQMNSNDFDTFENTNDEMIDLNNLNNFNDLKNDNNNNEINTFSIQNVFNDDMKENNEKKDNKDDKK